MKYRSSDYKNLKLAIDYLDSLPIDNVQNAIWHTLHQLVWHRGLDRVRWILENKELVRKISQLTDSELMDKKEIQNEIIESFKRLENYRR